MKVYNSRKSCVINMHSKYKMHYPKTDVSRNLEIFNLKNTTVLIETSIMLIHEQYYNEKFFELGQRIMFSKIKPLHS